MSNHLFRPYKRQSAPTGKRAAAMVLAALSLTLQVGADDPAADSYLAYSGTAGDLLGQSVANAGDVNNDGIPDHIIGIPGWGPFAQGRAVVRSGADGSVLRAFNGGSVADFLGASVAGAGDCDGDGYDDVIIGSPYSFLGAEVGGAAFVFSGFDGSELASLAGDQESEHLGTAVSGAGDCNGDGHADFIVGSPLFDGALGDQTGRIFINSGADGSVLMQWESIAGANLGQSVCGIGDVNGDGYDDIAAGAPGVATVYIIDVHNQAVLRTLSNAAFTSQFGASIADAGDIDNDGIDDLIIGAPDFLINGESRGRAYIHSGASGNLIQTVTGEGTDDHLGAAVAGAGDTDGDGAPDVIIGIPRDDRGGVDAGRVEVRDGATGILIAAHNAGVHYSEYAVSVAGLGDISGDGLADIIVGQPRAESDDRGGAYIYLGDANELGFDAAAGYSTAGHAPEFVLAADLTGDDRDDMVTVSPSTDSITIVLNNGDGSFGSPAHMTAGDAPTAAAAGDFDADGDLDLAVVSSKQNRIIMYRNNGHGAFTKTGTISTGKKPRSAAAADFDGDGRMDLAVANQNDDAVQVYINNHQINAPLHLHFAAPVSHAVKDGPIQVIVTNHNGDAHPDLMVLCQAAKRICVLINKGNGDFFNPKSTAIGEATVCIAAADLDDDSLDDVAYVSKIGNQVAVRHGNGNGTFNTAVKYTVGNSPRSVMLMDVSLDGVPDLLTCDQADDTVTWLINDGVGVMAPGSTVAVADDPVWLTGGDVDGDGDADVACAGRAADAVSVLPNSWF